MMIDIMGRVSAGNVTGSAMYLPAAICVAAAGLQAVCAGSGIKKRMAELRMPRSAPPLSMWVLIAALYYFVCFALLYRLLRLPPSTALRTSAVALVIAVMTINAAWNWFFFRSRNLAHAFAISVGYTFLAVVLLCVLLRVDLFAAGLLAPYVAYLGWANAWGYAMWKLNP
jgi:tryptophan-rich sensory protein